MKTGFNSIFVFILLLPVFYSFPSGAIAEPAFVKPGKYLVKYKSDKIKNKRGSKIRQINIKSQSKRTRPKRYHRFFNECGRLKRANPDISACSPDFMVKSQEADPYLFNCTIAANCLWPADNINDTDIDLNFAWQITEGSPDIVVAVLDTGLDLTHPDIAANIWINPNEIAGNSLDDDGNGYIDDIQGVSMVPGVTVQDDNGHGTHVAGIIAAIKDNGIGIAGAAPKVKILPVKILDFEGNGTISNAIKGVEYVVDLVNNHNIPIFVFNNSWGGAISDKTLLREAFEEANDAGILATAAAGNGNSLGVGINLDNSDFSPAELGVNNIISVASLDFNGKLSGFSNFGLNSVHLAAPGGTVRSLLASGVNFANLNGAENGTVLASGTSMSTPYVTGVLALMKAHLGNLSHAQIRDRLLQRVYPLPPDQSSKVITGGRLNAYYALTGDEVPLPTPLPTFTPSPTKTPGPVPTLLPSSTATPLPTIIITFAATPTQSLQPEETISAAQPTADVRLYPLSLISSQANQDNFIEAKKPNLLSVQVLNPSLSSQYKLTVSSGACILKDLTLANMKFSSIFRLQNAARKLKSLKIDLRDNAGKVLFEQVVSVNKGTKGKLKESCKVLKKNVILTGGT